MCSVLRKVGGQAVQQEVHASREVRRPVVVVDREMAGERGVLLAASLKVAVDGGRVLASSCCCQTASAEVEPVTKMVMAAAAADSSGPLKPAATRDA